MHSDEELYGAFLYGDEAAFDELMLRYGDSIVFYLFGYLHSAEDAEDLMIDAFARILVKKPAIREGCFKAYLYKTARNLAYRHHARSLKRREFSTEGMEALLSDGGSVDAFVGEKERNAALYRCLRRIDPQLREALWLVYSEGLSYAETAGILGTTEKRVDKLLSRAKKQMRTELEKEGVTNAYE